MTIYVHESGRYGFSRCVLFVDQSKPRQLPLSLPDNSQSIKNGGLTSGRLLEPEEGEHLQALSIENEILEKAKSWIRECGKEFFVELVALYLEDTAKRLLELRRALEVGDGPTLTREAHTIKSSSANVGAMKISAIAKEIEIAAWGDEMSQMAERVARTEAEFEFVKAALEALSSAPQEYANKEL